jgi:hypothetical protein
MMALLSGDLTGLSISYDVVNECRNLVGTNLGYFLIAHLVYKIL